MEAATAVPQTQKRLYRNNTAGYLGVVKLNHRGEEVGVNVDPNGVVWLSDDEATLTARAPKRPEDNPFEEQTFLVFDPEQGRHREVQIRPLTLADEARHVPDERYVPTSAEAQAIEGGISRPVARTSAAADIAPAAPPSTGSTAAQEVPPAPPAAVAAQTRPAPAPRSDRAPAAVGEAEEAESWVTDPEAPGQVLAGALAGDDKPPVDKSVPDATEHPGAGHVPTAGQAQAAPQTPGGAEEHAARVDPEVGEETGAAKPPAEPQPEGEYARAEEVGSPDAPVSNNDETLIGG